MQVCKLKSMPFQVLPYHRHTGVIRYDKISTIYISFNQSIDNRQVECDVIDGKKCRWSNVIVPVNALLRKDLKQPRFKSILKKPKNFNVYIMYTVHIYLILLISCYRGWKGTNCTECQSLAGCQHGKCTDQPDTCICDAGWQGHLCDEPTCA